MHIDVWTMLTHFIADAAKAAGMKSMKRRRKMIEVGYLVDSKGAQKFGTCASCGKGSDDDPKMVRVTYSHHDSISRTSNCLCADCRRLLLKTIIHLRAHVVKEWRGIIMKDDVISRQAAIDCVSYDVEHTIECLKALPSVASSTAQTTETSAQTTETSAQTTETSAQTTAPPTDGWVLCIARLPEPYRGGEE